MAQENETKKWQIAYEHDLGRGKILSAETEEQAIEIFRNANPMIVRDAPVRIVEDKVFYLWYAKGA